MDRIFVHEMDQLRDLLAEGRYWSNGKNIAVDHLHETGATSRFPKENIYGIYLANKAHMWMAFWMAVTRRDAVQKRALCYVETADHVGNLLLRSDIPDPLCGQAYLYLFDPARYTGMTQHDITGILNTDEAMGAAGFQKRRIMKKGREQENYFLPTPSLVEVDDWQLAITGVERIMPERELVLTPELIAAARTRISRTQEEIGADYIKRSSPLLSSRSRP